MEEAGTDFENKDLLDGKSGDEILHNHLSDIFKFSSLKIDELDGLKCFENGLSLLRGFGKNQISFNNE